MLVENYFVKMFKKIGAVILLLFVVCAVQAQVTADYSEQYNKLFSFQLLDVQQQKSTLLSGDDKSLFLFVFLSPECPLCQNYTKTLNELQQKYDHQINLYGIIAGNAYSIDDVHAFEKKYQTTFKIFIDTKQKLTHYLQASVTPQAILLDKNKRLIYTGAIDDWVQPQNKKKLLVTQHYLQDAIEQSLQSVEVKIKKTKAYGCKINDY